MSYQFSFKNQGLTKSLSFVNMDRFLVQILSSETFILILNVKFK